MFSPITFKHDHLKKECLKAHLGINGLSPRHEEETRQNIPFTSFFNMFVTVNFIQICSPVHNQSS